VGVGEGGLAPREVPAASPARRRGTRWPAIAVLAVVLIGGGVVVTKFLTSAIDYYCNVDEVGTKDGCQAGDRFRVQGVVLEDSLVEANDLTTFTIEFNDVELPVRYDRASEPGGIFQECVPVVVHGRLEDDAAGGRVFIGDSVEVKHSNEYEAANQDRLDQADTESAACQQQT
jgi:cytochrome c-type biogenesis protein CcmE